MLKVRLIRIEPCFFLLLLLALSVTGNAGGLPLVLIMYSQFRCTRYTLTRDAALPHDGAPLEPRSFSRAPGANPIVVTGSSHEPALAASHYHPYLRGTIAAPRPNLVPISHRGRSISI